MRNLPWYKTAVFYALDVETFQDSNGDGVGDFRGLIDRLDELAGLGVDCLWLLPFYPSPNRDNGYDVADYDDVDPRLGTLDDFEALVGEARRRGIRIIADLVVHHTSVQHRWFQEARRDPSSRYRDFYVWSADRPESPGGKPAFPGEQGGLWNWDEVAGAFYRHRFYPYQADLNTENPAVHEEFRRIASTWIDRGVSGFRVDAAHFLPSMSQGDDEQREVSHGLLWELRKLLHERGGELILMAEADVEESRIGDFFGEDDKAHLVLNFLFNQSLFLAMARGQAGPIADRLASLPDLPPGGQWATFVRNHDELTLARLSKSEREEVFRAFAPDEESRIYDRGIRRRLPPMLNGDQRRIRLAYSLLLTLPGSPVLRYGEAIGMGDKPELPGRSAVRTAMQWTDGPNAGFSSADPETLARPVVHSGPFGFKSINVAEQSRDPDSLLNWFSRALATRRRLPELSAGSCRVLDAGNTAVLAMVRRLDNQATLVLHNLSADPVDAVISQKALGGEPSETLLGSGDPPRDEGGSLRLRIGPYGTSWRRLG